MFKNIIKVLLSNFWVTLVGLINGFVFPKILSIDEYANYNIFLLYISYISILHLGFPSGMFINYGGKKLDEIDKRQYKSEVKIIYIILSIFTVLGLLLSCFIDDANILYVSIAIIPICVVGSYKSLYQAWGMFTEYSLLNMVVATFITGGSVGLYLINKNLSSKSMVILYLLVNIVAFIFISIQQFRLIIKVKSKKMFSEYNWNTLKVGFAVTLGNYINVLFYSLDKMFIKVLYSKHDFAMYSFAMSTQVIMTVFITAVSQPLYPKLASNDIDEDGCSLIKDLLLIFGSLSGCAYFACSIIVKLFLPNYIESLKVISIFFAVFPAMAVINSLYINLYKVTRQMKKYIFTLVLVFALAFTLNTIGVLIWNNYLIISVATTITFYFWLYYSSKHFTLVTLNIKDMVFIVGFLVLFFGTTRLLNDYIGIVVYFILIMLLAASIYRNSGMKFKRLFLKK